MTFGLAILHTPARRKRAGNYQARAPRYDCGEAGKLTAVEIASRAGVSRDGVLRRVARGVRGDALLSPKNRLTMPKGIGATRPTMALACRLALQFAGRVPSAREIQKFHPMSRATAYRWQDAMRDALEAE